MRMGPNGCPVASMHFRELLSMAYALRRVIINGTCHIAESDC